jgi:phytanoyl-CoA hydroxylase
MQYIDIRGTSQENIAKEVEEIAKRRGMELEFQVNSPIISIVGGISKLIFCIRGFQDIWRFRSRLCRGRDPSIPA